MRNIEVVSPREHKNWNDLLKRNYKSSFFHTSNWADVLQKSYGYKPIYFTIPGEDHLLNLLPVMEVESLLTGKRGVCLPFTDYCEPLAESSQQFRDLMNAAIVLGRRRKWKYLEIRGGEEFLPMEKPVQSFYGHNLDLSLGQKQIFSNLRDSTGRNIKKARKENITVTISTSMQSLKEFYRLNAMTRKEHWLPPQPYYFFERLYDSILTKDMGFIATAFTKNTPIAANIYLYSGDKVIYKYGASDKAFQRLRANNLLTWEAIKWSCDRGYKSFCFGRTEPENEGLRQFKNGWGAREYIIKYYKYDFRENAFTGKSSSINPLYKKIFKTLPIAVLNILGKILYRHMG
jgi:hypothetical protein